MMTTIRKRLLIASTALLFLVVGGVVGSRAFPRVEEEPGLSRPTPCVRAVWALGEEVAHTLRREGLDDPSIPDEVSVSTAEDLWRAYERTAHACITRNYDT